MCDSLWWWSGQHKFRQGNTLSNPTKVWILASPPIGVHLKQFQLHRARNRFGPALHVQFGEDILVVPLDRAQ